MRAQINAGFYLFSFLSVSEHVKRTDREFRDTAVGLQRMIMNSAAEKLSWRCCGLSKHMRLLEGNWIYVQEFRKDVAYGSHRQRVTG